MDWSCRLILLLLTLGFVGQCLVEEVPADTEDKQAPDPSNPKDDPKEVSEMELPLPDPKDPPNPPNPPKEKPPLAVDPKNPPKLSPSEPKSNQPDPPNPPEKKAPPVANPKNPAIPPPRPDPLNPPKPPEEKPPANPKTPLTSPPPEPSPISTETTENPKLATLKATILKELQQIDQKMHEFTAVLDKQQKCCFARDNEERQKFRREGCPPEKVINGKLVVNDDPNAVIDSGQQADSDKLIGANNYYDALAFCLKANFFGQFGVQKVRDTKLMERNHPKTPREHRKHWMQDWVLAIIEGNLLCNRTKTKAKRNIPHRIVVTFLIDFPEGSVPENCPKKLMQKNGYMFDYASETDEKTPFLAGGYIKDRYEYNVQILISHTCAGNATVHRVKFKPIKIENLRDNVFELRNLEIDLNNRVGPSQETIDWDWQKRQKGHGYTYFVPLTPDQKSSLPLAVDPAIFDDTAWSSYRPKLYFGLKNRRSDSPVFGILWYDQAMVATQHGYHLRYTTFYDRENNNISYAWDKHDGRTFGSQKIVDGDLKLQMRTDFFNFGKSSWMARVQLSSGDGWKSAKKGYAFIMYFALQDTISRLEAKDGTAENALKPSKHLEIPITTGTSPAVNGKFALKMRAKSSQEMSASKLLHRRTPFVSMGANIDHGKITFFGGNWMKKFLEKQSDGTMAFDSQKVVEEPNFVAVQIVVKADTTVEVLFQSEKDEPAPDRFEEEFQQRVSAFEARFNKIFPIPQNSPLIHHELGHVALSNLLGGIGVWHGSCNMGSRKFSKIKPYGPLSLISAVPNRGFFHRGFLWDEGFHNLLTYKFDPKLTLEIVGAYLDTMNVDGWIPREQALDAEAKASIELVENDWTANPPMFFYLLREMLDDKMFTKQYGPKEMKELYPRLKQLYKWLNNSQQGPLPGTFRWQDRDANNVLSINPDTLGSGFDDFPRATHPTDQEYHLDLRCWMAMSASVLARLAALVEDKEFLPEIQAEADMLMDVGNLEKLHWSEKAQQFCDYGLHSDDVVLSPSGVRQVNKKPQYGFVEDVNGYPNLFPFLLRLLPADSPRLAPLLSAIGDPKQFWTPFGLRSISTLSKTYYNVRLCQIDCNPYWRGPIWINMNYFALIALKHYASLQGPHRNECARLHDELRDALVSNMAKQFQETGFIWENYDDRDGHGFNNRPFTGWSALILNIMTGSY